MYVYVNLDFKRVNVEYARGTLDYYHYDTSSRTRGIRTVSRSCAYACAFSKQQIHEKLYRKHHTHTVSRSCEYACVWPRGMDIETPSRKHRTRVAFSFSSILS